jgi:putative DNA-invertase from lambdoid prophage Rac
MYMIYGYCRVSTEVQVEEGYSLRAQQRKILDYLRRNHPNDPYSILHDAGISASKPLSTRPVGSDLLRVLKKGDTVIAVSLDRLFRNAVDSLSTVEQWGEQDISLCLLDWKIDTKSAIGRASLGILAVFGQLELDTIKERIRAALKTIRSQGVHVGRPPYGYKVVSGRLCPDLDEQKTILFVLMQRNTGRTYDEIIEDLETAGFLPRSSGNWHRSSISRIIKAHR